MDLKTYFIGLSAPERDLFAASCSASRGHLQNIVYGFREPSGEMSAAIEQASVGAVTVEELRPDIRWHRIPDPNWPHPAGRPLVDVTTHQEPANA